MPTSLAGDIAYSYPQNANLNVRWINVCNAKNNEYRKGKVPFQSDGCTVQQLVSWRGGLYCSPPDVC